MTIKKQLLSMTAIAVGLLTIMSSCALIPQDEDPDYSYIQAIAYQMKEDGKYGMMDLNGVSIIEPRFENEPTEASCDRFFAQDEDGLWELYTLEANPQRVGTAKYKDVGAFVNGLCPVSEPGSDPIYINTQGEKVFGIDSYEDDEGNTCRIIGAGIFQDGMASIMGENELFGFIDKEGNVVVKPQYKSVKKYQHGFALAEKPIMHDYAEDEDVQAWVILDKQGNELFSASNEEMNPIQDGFDEKGRLLVYNEDQNYVFINSQGEELQTFESDVVSGIEGAYNGLMNYFNGKFKNGLIKEDGEIIIKARYDDIEWVGGLVVAKQKIDDDGVKDRDFTILNTEGKILKKIKASRIWLPDYRYKGFENRLLCFKDSKDDKKTRYFIGEDGEKVESSITFSSLAGLTKDMAGTGNEFEDILFNHMKFTKEGFAGCKINDLYKDMNIDILHFKVRDDEKSGTLEYSFLSQDYVLLYIFDKNLNDYDTYNDRRLQCLLVAFVGKNHTKIYEKFKTKIQEIAPYVDKGQFDDIEGEAYDPGNGLHYLVADNSEKEAAFVVISR